MQLTDIAGIVLVVVVVLAVCRAVVKRIMCMIRPPRRKPTPALAVHAPTVTRARAARVAMRGGRGVERILVTGGCGFVGSRVVAQLLGLYEPQVGEPAQDAACAAYATVGHDVGQGQQRRWTVELAGGLGGVEVVVLDKVLSAPRRRHPLATYMCGDVTDAAHLARACEGVDTVIHVAALLPSITTPKAVLDAVNVGGTRAVVRACQLAGVSRLILTSSASASLRTATAVQERMEESVPHPALDDCVDDYARTKVLAEAALREADTGTGGDGGDGGAGLRCVALRPCAVYGLGDRNLADSILSGESGCVAWCGAVLRRV